MVAEQQEHKVCQQAADLKTCLADVIKQCNEDQLLSKLGLVLFEQLGKEYPDMLCTIIAAEGAITNIAGMTQMNPPVKDLREYPNTHINRVLSVTKMQASTGIVIIYTDYATHLNLFDLLGVAHHCPTEPSIFDKGQFTTRKGPPDAARGTTS
jgi:hypothetical protein